MRQAQSARAGNAGKRYIIGFHHRRELAAIGDAAGMRKVQLGDVDIAVAVRRPQVFFGTDFLIAVVFCG